MMMERKQSDQQSGLPLPPSRLSAISASKWRTTTLFCPQLPHAPSSGQVLGSHTNLGAGTRRVVPSRYVAIPRLVRY